MSRESEFIENCKEMSKQKYIGSEEMRIFYLSEIALHLAIIADCLEDRKERKKDECYRQGHVNAGEMQ